MLVALLSFFLTAPRSNHQVIIGTVDANSVIVSSNIGGRIERLTVDEGDVVRRGDVIAIIDSRELEAQKVAAQTTIAGLEQRVEEARSQTLQAQEESSSQLENARVRVEAARSAEVQAKAELDRVRSDAQRVIKLADVGVASQAEKDRAHAQLQSAGAALTTATEGVRSAEDDLSTYKARVQQATAARRRLLAAKEDVRTAEANLSQAEVRLRDATIRAPISGRVSVRAAREGEVIQPGEAIITIVDVSDTWVFAALPETQAGHVAIGDAMNVELPWGVRVSGKVFYKAAEADFATQRDVSLRKRDIKTIAIKIRVSNESGTLVPGMSAEVPMP